MSPNPKRNKNRKKESKKEWNNPKEINEFELSEEFDNTPRVPSRDRIQKMFVSQKAETARKGNGKKTPSYAKHLHK